MNHLSNRYLKVVEWSSEDNCFIGTAPGLFMGGVHGDDQTQVFQELCSVVDDVVTLFESEGKPLPAPTADKNYSGKISLRIPPELHKTVAIRASQTDESINKFIQHQLESALRV